MDNLIEAIKQLKKEKNAICLLYTSFFGIATKFEEIMARLGDRPKVRIIRMRKVPFIDSTGIHNLTSLCEMSRCV